MSPRRSWNACSMVLHKQSHFASSTVATSSSAHDLSVSQSSVLQAKPGGGEGAGFLPSGKCLPRFCRATACRYQAQHPMGPCTCECSRLHLLHAALSCPACRWVHSALTLGSQPTALHSVPSVCAAGPGLRRTDHSGQPRAPPAAGCLRCPQKPWRSWAWQVRGWSLAAGWGHQCPARARGRTSTGWRPRCLHAAGAPLSLPRCRCGRQTLGCRLARFSAPQMHHSGCPHEPRAKGSCCRTLCSGGLHDILGSSDCGQLKPTPAVVGSWGAGAPAVALTSGLGGLQSTHSAPVGEAHLLQLAQRLLVHLPGHKFQSSCADCLNCYAASWPLHTRQQCASSQLPQRVRCSIASALYTQRCA